jgi:hypothetical protein
MPSALISVRLFIRGHGGFTLQWPWDRGQIDSRARAFRSHHRGGRRRGIPAGAQLVAVVDHERLAGVEREVGACQLAESCAFCVQRFEHAGAFGLVGGEVSMPAAAGFACQLGLEETGFHPTFEFA